MAAFFFMARRVMTRQKQPSTAKTTSAMKMGLKASAPWATIRPPNQLWTKVSGRKPMTDSRPEAVPKMLIGTLASVRGEEPMEKAP